MYPVPRTLSLFLFLVNFVIVISGKKRVEPPKTDYESLDGLRWKDLRVESKSGNILLASTEGFIPNGKIAGIIGPSGAGKSTLLAALSGSTSKGSKKVSGNVWFVRTDAGTRSIFTRSVKDVALLRQHDSFFSMLTPRETMNLATFLQLDLNPKEQQKIVDTTLDKLGLRHVENMTIGHTSHDHGCLSGGERRRLSVALELVSSPKVFIADEPTSGLDSAQAQKVFLAIVKAARERKIPCICSLHQPRASIWKELDYFILMAPGGKIVYQGERESSTQYFAELGYDCPNETTPAEFFIDLVTIDSEDEDQAKLDRERVDFLVSAYQKHVEKTVPNDATEYSHVSLYDMHPSSSRHHRHRRFPSRVGALLLRSLRQNLRDIRVNFLRTTAAIGLARLFAELFSGTKKGVSNAKSVADRTALLSYGVINMTMMAMMKTINLFGREKEVVQRERMRKQYTSLDYLLSKSIAELPLDMFFSSIFAYSLKSFTGISTPLMHLIGIFSTLTLASASLGFAVGSFTSNVEEAMTLGFPIMTVLMAVGVINPSGVDESVKKPLIIKILKKFSPVASAIEALCISEFKGMHFDQEGKSSRWSLRDLPRMGALALVRNGDDVLRALGLFQKSFHECIRDLGIMSLISLTGSWIGLNLSGTEVQENYEKNDEDSNDMILAVDPSSSSANVITNLPSLKLI